MFFLGDFCLEEPTFRILLLTESNYDINYFQHYLDPPKDLLEALRSKGIAETSFFTLKHGETRVIK